jgi:hypothetical protein
VLRLVFQPSLPCHLAMMSFEIIGETTDIETLAVGSGIREVERLQKQYG